MTDQPRIANIASSAADEAARLIAKRTTIPMLVLVTVTNAGETIAEGYADTRDYQPRTAVPLVRDPDA